MKTFLRRYPVSLLLAALIFYVCLIRVPSLGIRFFTGTDKVVHFLMYFTLCLCVWGEYLRSHTRLQGLKLLLWAVSAPIAMSGLIELAQEYLTTYRSGDWRDFAANSAGALIAALAGRCVLPRLGFFKPKPRRSR